MTPPNLALYITCLFLTNMAPMATSNQSSLHFQSDDVGESVTLTCVCDDAALIFYWYKQTLGQKPKLMSSFYRYNNNSTFHDEYKNNLRFSLEYESSKSHLKISDLQISDSATYFCVASNLYNLKFCESATVNVKGSGLNVPVLVHQSASETIQPGGSVTLNCTVHTGTCDGQHSVYWFKDSEDSHPGLIYTHGGSNDQCERKHNTQTHTCSYNLPNVSHDGTYYCAVASCGHILFGDGIKLDFDDDGGSLVYFLSGALTFTTILVVFLSFSVYKMSQRNSQSPECNVTFSASSTQNTALCQEAENLHYAALRDPSGNGSRRQRDNTLSECVYSSVRP